MNNFDIKYAIILMVGVFLGAISQVMLKKASQREYKSVLQEYMNARVIIAYMIFFGTTVLSVLAYKGIPLSMGPILESTSYIYVTIFGVTIFKEHINLKKVIALLMIIIGIVIYSIN